MKLKALGIIAAMTLIPAAAFAQASTTASRNNANTTTGVWANTQAPQPNSDHAASGAPARDGCVNVPGEAHNSADCSKIDASDMNTAMNRPSTDAAGRPTGTTENAERNARILSGQALN